MIRELHGAPAQALTDALAALARHSSWVSWTADADLRPSAPASDARRRGGTSQGRTPS